MGEMDKAVRDFKWCADRNPRNTDAAREVRLYAMRSGGKSPAANTRRRELTPGKVFAVEVTVPAYPELDTQRKSIAAQ